MAFQKIVGTSTGNIYGILPTGKLIWYKDIVQNGSNGSFAQTGWHVNSKSQVGWNWANFKHVISGGNGIIYAVKYTGELIFYKDLVQDGTNGSLAQTGWHPNSGNQIGWGWGNFKSIFAGGNGIIYAIKYSGELIFYKDIKQDGTNGPLAQTGWHVNSGQQIGWNWANFKDVFSNGNGVIYAIKVTGELIFYKDLVQNGTNGPLAQTGWHLNSGNQIGWDWQDFKFVFSGGNGVIYAVRYDGKLSWYRDTKQDGTNGALAQTGWASNSGARIGWEWYNAPSRKTCGYADKSSVSPDEVINFQVSSESPYSVKYIKLEIHGENIGSQLLNTFNLPALTQYIPNEAYKLGCSWSTTFSLTIPTGWQSGFYAVQLIDDEGDSAFIIFIVKPLLLNRKKIILIANTNTWCAYNDWGGKNKYSVPPSALLSLFRPNPLCNPYDDGERNHLTRAELWVYSWLIQNNFEVDVYSDYDFHLGIDDPEFYKLIILSTHPEYWTTSMFNKLNDFSGFGLNVIYIAGNGIFEKVSVIGGYEQLSYLNNNDDDYRPLSFFRNLVPPLPERNILGVAFRFDITDNYAPFKVLLPDHEFYTGTNLQINDLFGVEGLNGSASGWEMDTSVAGNAPSDVIVTATASDDRGQSPGNIQLLARGVNVKPIRVGVIEYGADITYYDTVGGGFIFCIGSLSAGGSLVVDSNLHIIMTNAIQKALL